MSDLTIKVEDVEKVNPEKFGWPSVMLLCDVGDNVTIIDINGKEWTGIVQADGTILGEPEWTVAPDCTFHMIASEERVASEGMNSDD